MVMAWKIEKALICPDCGSYYEEWDPAKGGHIHAYWPNPIHCFGCKAKADKYDSIRQNSTGKDESVTHGLQMGLVKNPDTPNIRSPMNNKPIITR